MRDLGIIILNIIIALALNAQDKYAPKNIERNNIKEIDCYLFEENSKTDSFLITKEDFNSKESERKLLFMTLLEQFKVNTYTITNMILLELNASLNSMAIFHLEQKYFTIKIIEK